MIKVCTVSLVALLSLPVLAQDIDEVPASTIQFATNRTSVIKGSFEFPEAQGQAFWPIYEQYEREQQIPSGCAFVALNTLARAQSSIKDEEAFDCVRNLIAHRYDKLSVKKQYFEQVNNQINGKMALQFLQAEELLDLMTCWSIFEGTSWQKIVADPYSVVSSDRIEEKHQIITAVLSLPETAHEKFRGLYDAYESECSVLLGEGLSMFEQYIREVSDLTPAQASRFGSEFLSLQQKEAKLKERYFLEMNEAMGPGLAARFIALEDYFSVIGKMKVWAEAPTGK